MAKKVGSIYAEIRAKIDKYEKDLAKAHSSAVTASNKIQKSIDRINFDKAGAAADRFKATLMGVFAGVGVVGIARNVLDVNASFERLQAKLDTLTPGQGKATFDYLYNLVRDLPVGIESITQGFITMTAMGLKPTEKQLLTLTDVASVLGEDVFGRVVLQLGQMASKGKVMAQDLNILAEAGINARGYIKQAFDMTTEQIQESGVDIQHVVDTIFEGMDVQFGGATKKMANTWDGVVAQLKKGWQDLSITLGEAGFFEASKQAIRELTDELKMLAKFANLRSILGTRAEGLKYVSRGLISQMEWDAADVYRKQELVDWAKKLDNAKFITSDEGAAGVLPSADRAEITKGIQDRRALVENVAQAKTEMSAAAKEAERFAEEIRKLEEEFEKSKIFSGEKSNFEIMEQQLRNGAELSQMYAEAAKTANEEFEKQALRENELLMIKVDEYDKAFKSIESLSERTAEAMQDNFSDLFFDAMTGELKSLEDYASAVFRSIQRMVADLAAQQLTRGLFGPEMKGGGWLSQLFGLGGGGAGSLPINQPGFPGAATFHGGGVVGMGGGASRRIPSSAFSFAPRLHSGLMPDEYPAVLQKGEAVIPRGGGAGGSASNYYYISAMDTQSIVQALRRAGAVPMLAAENIQANGMLRKAMRT